MVATDDRHSATVQLTFSEFVEFQFTFLSNIDNYLSHAIVNVGPIIDYRNNTFKKSWPPRSESCSYATE